MKKQSTLPVKILKFPEHCIEWIGIIIVAVMVTSITANIFLRWLTGRSFGELDDLSLISLVWVIYVGTGLLYRSNEHIRMDFLIRLLPERWKNIINLIAGAVSIAVSSTTLYLAIKLMLRSFSRTTNVMHVPYSFLHLAIVIGFASLALYVMTDFVRTALAVFRYKEVISK